MKRQVHKQVINLSLCFAVCMLPFMPLSAQTWTDGEASFTSLALSGGTPYVAYVDYANGNKVTVKKHNDTAWETMGFNVVGYTNVAPSLALSGSTLYREISTAAEPQRLYYLAGNSGTVAESIVAFGLGVRVA